MLIDITMEENNAKERIVMSGMSRIEGFMVSSVSGDGVTIRYIKVPESGTRDVSI